MGKNHKKYKPEWRTVDGDYENQPLDKPLKLMLKVRGSEVTKLSGSGHDLSYYDDPSDHERERHKEKKKKKSEKEKDKHMDDAEKRRKEEKKKKREKKQLATSAPVEPFTLTKPVEVVVVEQRKRKREKFKPKAEEFHPSVKVEPETQVDRPVRACRTQQESESTPRQQLLKHFLCLLQRKDPRGYFAFPVTDSIAPGYSMIIKHPMDFSTMKDKIAINDYKTVTEFKVFGAHS